jgi:hypothetical protein
MLTKTICASIAGLFLGCSPITQNVTAQDGTEIHRTYQTYQGNLIRSDDFIKSDSEKHYTCIWQGKRKSSTSVHFKASYLHLLEVRENDEISMNVDNVDVCLEYSSI